MTEGKIAWICVSSKFAGFICIIAISAMSDSMPIAILALVAISFLEVATRFANRLPVGYFRKDENQRLHPW